MRGNIIDRLNSIEKEKEAKLINEILKELNAKEKKDLLIFIQGMKFAEIISMK